MTKSLTSQANGKITRRQLAGVAAGSAAVSLAVVNAMSQTPGANQDWDKAARESHRDRAKLANVGRPAPRRIPHLLSQLL